jgi:hypothetical protein
MAYQDITMVLPLRPVVLIVFEIFAVAADATIFAA